MNRFDTMLIGFPRLAIKDFDSQYFTNSAMNLNTNESWNHKTQDLHEHFKGFNFVKITDNEVIIECSAKIHVKDYLQGTNKNNFLNIHKTITNVIDISESDFIHTARIHRCHTTDNLILKNYNLNQYMSAMRIHTNPRYNVTKYKNQGFQFKKGTVSAKIYDKELELNSNKGNLELLNLHPNLKDECKNVGRFEAEHNSHRTIRTIFDCDVLSWNNVLNSKVKANAVIFDKIISTETKPMIHTFDKVHDAKQYFYMENVLLNKCDNDLDKVKEFLKLIYSEKVHKPNIIREYNAIAEFKKQYDSNEFLNIGIDSTELVKEMKSQLAK